MRTRMTAILLLFFAWRTEAQEFIPLWPKGKMPNTKGLPLKDSIINERAYRIMDPGMYAFFPSKDDNNGSAILIFPGGGYDHLTYVLGGFQLAKWFNMMGTTAFVVNYRLPTSPDLKQRETGPLQDAQRAMRIVRANAGKWRLNLDKIGVQGSSAGGHLASLVATHAEDLSAIGDTLDGISFRPDFMILVSPVIDLGEYAHKGSRSNLLGPSPSAELIKKYSTQNGVDAHTPPAFIADAINDKTVPPINSLLFYQALLQNKVSASFHVFPQGGHAIGTNNNPGSTALWTTLCEMWLKEMGFITWK
ncbi:MAG: alpha/beta hydrolase [Bacteroidetes bacterium]|nr:alpha/beta hydrolase [Bacteroidota bacterium]